jgi:hypothetical protein
MQFRNGITGVVLLAGLMAVALAAPAAHAGVATYNSTAPLFVPDGTTVNSTITVPPGRTPVQSLEATNLSISWGASSQELSTQLIAPEGTFMNLFEIGCANYSPQDIYAFSDAATLTAPNAKNDPKCDLGGGTFKPVDLPENRKLSIFSGKQSSGTWTLRANDTAAQFNNQGTIQTWALRVVHAPPKLNVDAPNKVKTKGDSLFALADANGTMTVGGGSVQPETKTVTANAPVQIPIRIQTPKRRKQKKARSVTIPVAFTDETGGTASTSVTVRVKEKRKKKK